MKNIDEVLGKIKRIHFIGIGGSGMCPLVEILHSKGYEISGSDNNESDTLNRVRSLGIPVFLGQRAQNIEGAQMIVYTAALLPDNPELCAAKESGIPTFERKELLGAITRMFDNCICVCGTHGKTTVTAMLTQIFLQSGADPTAVIGGKLPLTGTNGIAGGSQNMLCEACEFVDTFLSLSPDVSVILNIDEDHLDYFKTLDNLIASFTKFASMTRREIIINADDANTLRAVESIKDKRFITFGLGKDNDFRAENIVLEHEFASFDIIKYGENVGRISLGIPGKHNIFNALAAIAAADNAGIPMDKIIACAEQFRGAGRRFEILKKINGITIADDYAHHPRELEVTLNAAMGMGFKRVWAVFQPFTYSRTKILFDDFVRVLKIPDRVVMTEIMGSRERNTYGVYTSQLAEKIPGSVWFNTFDEVADYVVKNAEEGDLVITLGCGDIYKAAKLMIKKYENRD
ncbi:MAG: UDP-N-acetylmuramate--L-alanine ligase [Clostridia bacterium]|nr:UDP-N-acetylmuramate--L-alanine ligase [Clostridia bacterium]